MIESNNASSYGGGAYKAALTQCVLTGNVVGSSGGGAYGCNLANCHVTANAARQSNGGGTASCLATNCAYTLNSSLYDGGAAYSGTLVNCTVSENISSGYSSGYGAAVYGATLVNSIVYDNFSRTSYATNYAACTMTYCCSDPLPSGTGNIDANPQLLGDEVHLAEASPCIGAGTESVVSGADIDGQAWSNPPSIGCDEWQPAPVIATPPVVQIGLPAYGLTVGALVAGGPASYLWSLNGNLLQDNGHFTGSGTGNLAVNNIGPTDAGFYQLVVSNAFGVATSQVAQVVIHVVNTAAVNSVPPYLMWATAATNIQDAVNVAAAGDIVLVTNGVYAFGGGAVAGNLTNRVAVNLPVTVMSANGAAVTVIQGAWDPVSTNGPGAVRCAYVADGAVLTGFTLENGATRATGDGYGGGPLESGGGVLCNSTNGIVSNCILTNNSAIYGAGIANGTLNNSLVLFNQSFGYGGGAYDATLNNCNVGNNYDNVNSTAANYGAGTYGGITRNSIVLGNYDNAPFQTVADNYYPPYLPGQNYYYYYCCTSPTISGNGNTNVNAEFLDWYHITTTSPCRGAGSALYASGTDLDGEPWANPPSMGCSEVVPANLVGPLSVSMVAVQTNALLNHEDGFTGYVTGRASGMVWTFGDGLALTNYGVGVIHEWTNAGNYPVTFTVYNNDNPAGVSAVVNINVQPLAAAQLQSAALLASRFQFQFASQAGANYTIQYATNLVPPVTWNTLQNIFGSGGGVTQITDPSATGGTRFYRVLAQ